MTERGARIVAIAVIAFLTLSVSLGQSRGQRGAPPRGAGSAIPPEPGYVPPAEPVSAGTASPAAIPPDASDQAFWAMYDRDKHVTITGKVTRVNWSNPNTYIFVQSSGGVEWAVEASFVQFRQSHITPAVRANQTITITGYLAKEDPGAKLSKSSPSVLSYQKAKHLIRAAENTTEYGQTLKMGRPLSEEEEKSDLLHCPTC